MEIASSPNLIPTAHHLPTYLPTYCQGDDNIILIKYTTNAENWL